MKFTFETHVRSPLAETFRFFSNPGNLALVLHDMPSFRILRHDNSVAPGSQTWVQASALGVMPIVMGFEHVHCDPEKSFSEKLVHGPFSRFDHLHEFRAQDSGTLIRDILDITLPWQYGGSLVMSTLVSRIVHRTFQMRKAKTAELLDGSA